MFGAGMPILFPIALASFVTLYLMERLLVAYSYQRPPMFDSSLNNLTLRYLVYAPLLFCSVGYWVLSNRQTFDNVVFPRTFYDSGIETGHNILTIFKLNNATPLLIFLLIFTIMSIFSKQSEKFL